MEVGVNGRVSGTLIEGGGGGWNTGFSEGRPEEGITFEMLIKKIFFKKPEIQGMFGKYSQFKPG